MTFISCWNHLEAAVITEVAAIKDESERTKQQGGTEVIGATITVQSCTNSKCQICGKDSLFSVYYQAQYKLSFK